jgi:hypothetical protein
MDMQIANILIIAIVAIGGYLILFTDIQFELPTFFTFENFKSPEGVRKLRIDEVKDFSEEMKNDLFEYANARGEYKHLIFNGVLMPIGNIVMIVATLIVPRLLLNDETKSLPISSVVELAMPYLQWGMIILIIPLTIFKLYQYNPLKAIFLRTVIKTHIAHYARKYQFDVTAVNHEHLWMETIKNTQLPEGL